MLHIHIFFNLVTAFLCYSQKSGGTIKVALYNVTADPYESEDLKSTYPALVRTLRRRVTYYKRARYLLGKLTLIQKQKHWRSKMGIGAHGLTEI